MAMVSPFSALASARVVESVSSVPSLYSFISFGSCRTEHLVVCVALPREDFSPMTFHHIILQCSLSCSMRPSWGGKAPSL